MRNKFIVLFLAVCVAATSYSFAFAEENEDAVTNLDRTYMSDYSIDTALENDVFNPGEFCVELAMNAVEWLGNSNSPITDKSSAIQIKTGANVIKISEALPNLKTFIAADEIAKSSMAGNTFTCRNTPDTSWNETTGRWQTIIDAPKDNIRYALDEIKKSLSVKAIQMRLSDETKSVSFYDNMLYITQGSSFQYGNDVITFTKDCEIDELYDGLWQKTYYESTFAENVYRVRNSTEKSTADDNTIKLTIGAGSFMQICENRFTADSDIDIVIDNASIGNEDPLAAVYEAICTAEQAKDENGKKIPYRDDYGRWSNDHKDMYADYNDIHPAKVYYIHTCDADALFGSAFGVVNDLLGVLSNRDAKIKVIPAETEVVIEPEGRTAEPDAEVSAELKVTSAPWSAPCTHENTEVRDAFKPTVTTVGYSGDVYCKDCGILIYEGEMLPKLPSSIKLNYTSLKLKVKQSTSAVKVTFVKGDSIKSVTTSNSSIVKAAKSGSTGIKLTAGSKTGKATVTVKLASQKSAKITVTVQKSEVACTGIKVTSGTSVSIKKGKTHQIKVTRSPVTCVQKVTYKTSNKKVATVSSSGKVKGVKKGTAKITIKCGKKSKTIKITVK